MNRYKQLLQEFDDRFGDSVETDWEIRGSDAVDWVSEFAPRVRALLTLEADPQTELLEQLARLQTDEEMDGDMSGDDAASTLSEFIEFARGVL